MIFNTELRELFDGTYDLYETGTLGTQVLPAGSRRPALEGTLEPQKMIQVNHKDHFFTT